MSRLGGSGWGGCLGPHPGGEVGVWMGGVQAHTWGGGFQAHTWEGVSRSTTRGGQAQEHTLRQTPPPQVDSYRCGRYASYWNAFLFGNVSGLTQCTHKPSMPSVHIGSACTHLHSDVYQPPMKWECNVFTGE